MTTNKDTDPNKLFFKFLDHLAAHGSDLLHVDFKILVYLMRRHGVDGKIYPGAKTITEECHISKRYLWKRLRILKKIGWVDYDHEDTYTNSYKVLFYSPPSELQITSELQDTSELQITTGSDLQITRWCPTDHQGSDLQITQIEKIIENRIDRSHTVAIAPVSEISPIDSLVQKPTTLSAPLPAPCRFEEVFRSYPVIGDHRSAKKIWERLKLNERVGEILLDIENRKANHIRWQNPRFIPKLEKYLSSEGWNHSIIGDTENEDNSAISSTSKSRAAKSTDDYMQRLKARYKLQ